MVVVLEYSALALLALEEPSAATGLVVEGVPVEQTEEREQVLQEMVDFMVAAAVVTTTQARSTQPVVAVLSELFGAVVQHIQILVQEP
jgi:hypothetical protein